jgi:uncharacterized Fe-S cluster-containing radical SAM superfamily protein
VSGATIDTDAFSVTMRERGVDRDAGTLRITSFVDSKQERDLTEPANCQGFGRIRHFRRETSAGWPENSLPIEPAARALGVDPTPLRLEAQVFQNAVCNWRCWYCFVDFELLSGRQDRSSMLSAERLVNLYLAEPSRPKIIDLSGGQPDLVPEWVPWMMRALSAAGISDQVFLWSDDNLSNDYFWRYLSEDERTLISDYRMYGKVCCFKGFDAHSFARNTAAAPELFDRQFALMRRLINETTIDLYAYVTLTTDQPTGIESAMSAFIDRLQALDANLPLRTVPLEITAFTPVLPRMNTEHQRALSLQEEAIAAWDEELVRRFSEHERARAICDVPLAGR